MKTLSLHNRRPPRLSSGCLVLLVAWLCVAITEARAFQTQPPPVTPPGDTAPTPATPQAPALETPPSPADSKKLGPPVEPSVSFNAESVRVSDVDNTLVADKNVVISYAGVTIHADHAEGNFDREIILSGHVKVEERGAVSYADAIHVYPNTRTYRLENPRATLQPEFLQNRVLDPVFVTGGSLFGARNGYSYGEHVIITTCIEKTPHYELRARSAELIPHKRLILRHVAVMFFGQRLVDIPYLVIPLDERPRRYRTDYLPEFGRNTNEGYFARFPYSFAIGAAAATLLRLDITEKLGEGYRVEQEYLAGKQPSQYSTAGYGYSGNSGYGNSSFGGGYSGDTGSGGAFNTAYGYGTLSPRLPRLGTGLGPQNGGLLGLQGYFNQGFDRNFSASYRHQQDIGGSNRFGLTTELRRNSFYTLSDPGSDQTNLNTTFNFAHNDTAHGINLDASLSLQKNDSSGFSSNNIAGHLNESVEFDSRGSNRNTLSYNLDLSRVLTLSPGSDSRTAQLDTRFQFEHVSRDYSFDLRANKTTPIGPQSSIFYGSMSSLPELQFASDTVNFKGGWLHNLPLHLDLGVGRYSEPSSNIQTERALLGFTLQETQIMRGNTEMTTGGGFEQRFYGDDAALYVLRNTTRLRQHFGHRSGFDISYQYLQPAGGTPFTFDQLYPQHSLTAQAGYLDDPHFQLTAGVGYDLTANARTNPWQYLSTRLMWRPSPGFRFDSLSTFDPNTSRLFSVINALRFRGRNNFAFDINSFYDAQHGRFGQVNSQFDIPLGRAWRLAGLLQYDGSSGRFASTNLQLIHTWDCMEASVTYSETPLGFRNDRELFLSIRLTAFPFFRSFARSPGGDVLGTGVGELY